MTNAPATMNPKILIRQDVPKVKHTSRSLDASTALDLRTSKGEKTVLRAIDQSRHREDQTEMHQKGDPSSS